MAKSMRILAVSDRVIPQLYRSDVKQQYPDVALIVGCGDLPFYYLEFLVSSFDVPLVYVQGNHDEGLQYTADGRTLSHASGGENIHSRVVQRKGLIIAGLEGSMRYRPERTLMYTENEMRYEVARIIPRLLLNRAKFGRALDILVTHSPPYGIHDMPDLPHTGFRIFRKFLTAFRPKYLLHGHVHVYRQDTVCVTQFEETHVVNVYPFRLIDFNAPPKK
jgi:Icc-related predicted phosphoesterase